VKDCKNLAALRREVLYWDFVSAARAPHAKRVGRDELHGVEKCSGKHGIGSRLGPPHGECSERSRSADPAAFVFIHAACRGQHMPYAGPEWHEGGPGSPGAGAE
jgi:hypothetical protein